MTFEEAYLAWCEHMPTKGTTPAEIRTFKKDGSTRSYKVSSSYAGDCCQGPHTKVVFHPVSGSHQVPLSDEEVCPRERTWRVYVRIRDSRITTKH
jgi:hypothetical protein